MRRLLVLSIAVAALAQAGTAAAGCWATVGLAPPPDGIAPGERWTARLTVLQHGRTPLPDARDARPTLTIRNDATGAAKTFTARPTDDPTLFTAAVVFPSAGSWRYEVFDDFGTWEGEPAPCARTHTFAAVSVGGAPAGGAGPPAATAEPVAAGGFPLWAVGAGALGALALGAAAWSVVRRRRSGPAPAVR